MDNWSIRPDDIIIENGANDPDTLNEEDYEYIPLEHMKDHIADYINKFVFLISIEDEDNDVNL